MKKLSARMLSARRRREQRHIFVAIAYFGSKAALGRALGVTTQAVQQWCTKGVPIERCPQIESATRGRVQCEQLREDYAQFDARPYRRALEAR